MLISSRFKIKTKWGYVPIFDSLLSLTLFTVRICQPSSDSNAWDFHLVMTRISEKCPSDRRFPTIFRRLPNVDDLWTFPKLFDAFPMAFELIVKKKKEIIKINEMKFISLCVDKGQFVGICTSDLRICPRCDRCFKSAGVRLTHRFFSHKSEARSLSVHFVCASGFS